MNPITKAHKEGTEAFKKQFSHSEFCTNFHDPIPPKQCRCSYDDFQSFLATYAKMILNAAKEAGPKKVDDDGLVSTWEAGNNDCIDGFCSAIDEGIKEIKKGDV